MIKTIRHCVYYANIGKMEELKKIDSFVKELKNQMSQFTFKHLDEFIGTNNSRQFANKYYKQFANQYLSAWETQALMGIVCTHYEIIILQTFKNYKPEVQKSIKYIYYKKNYLEHKMGDLKDKEITFRTPKIGYLIKYLIYYTDKIYNQEVLNKLNSYDKSVQNRIFQLAKQIRQRLLKRVKLIEFKTGSYKKMGYMTSARKDIVFQKDETNKKYQYWYCYRTRERDLWLPLQINKNYHKDFNSKEHIVVVRKNKLLIFTPHEFEQLSFKEQKNIIGVDVNVKHNLFTCSNGATFDYDRKYVKKLTELLIKNDQIQLNNNYSERKVNASNKRVSKTLRVNEWYFKKEISKFLNWCVKKNITDVVLENLNLSKSTFIRNTEFNGVKYSRLVKLMRLSNIKNWMLGQAEKRGIRVHTTPAMYTSQQCPICGYISRDNRPRQEDFKCVHCGHEDNADRNAAINIYLRYVLDVLRQDKTLHKIDEFNRMQANNCYRKKLRVQEILESNILKTQM